MVYCIFSDKDGLFFDCDARLALISGVSLPKVIVRCMVRGGHTYYRSDDDFLELGSLI